MEPLQISFVSFATNITFRSNTSLLTVFAANIAGVNSGIGQVGLQGYGQSTSLVISLSKYQSPMASLTVCTNTLLFYLAVPREKGNTQNSEFFENQCINIIRRIPYCALLGLMAQTMYPDHYSGNVESKSLRKSHSPFP